MSFRYIRNHKDHTATKCESIADLDLTLPEFKNKVEIHDELTISGSNF